MIESQGQPVEAPLDKHKRYQKMYRPNEIFWGLGLENETYIQILPDLEKPANFFSNRKRERYSVDYWQIYKKGVVESLFQKHIEDLESQSKCFLTKGPSFTTVKFPRLINAHSFQNTDRTGQPKKTYEKVPRNNPRFNGNTLLEDLRDSYIPEVRKYIENNYDRTFCFDGDSIEFITQQFLNAKVDDCVEELLTLKKNFLSIMQKGFDYLHKKEQWLNGTLAFPPVNHGFAVFHTNRNNVAIFNNSTYHINVTLPTQLNDKGLIEDWPAFVEKHRQFARLFQWISPLLVVKYGSGDVLGRLDASYDDQKKDGESEKSYQFPLGSQRLCVSRYVSVATYDTDVMKTGKLLVFENPKLPWMTEIYEKPECAYNMLNLCGCDINFHKHVNHGLELRIFDWFPEHFLNVLMRLLVFMGDEAVCHFEEKTQVPNPLKDETFNHFLAKAVWEGHNMSLEEKEVAKLFEIFNVKEEFDPNKIENCEVLFNIIYENLKSRWENKGKVSLCML